MGVNNYNTLDPRGSQQLTVSTAAVPLTVPAQTASKPGPNYATIRCATANVRYRDDGTAPTATTGIPLKVDEILVYDGPLGAVQFIRSGGADATLDILYYRA